MVVAAAASALVVNVLDYGVFVVVVLHKQGHVDDDLLVVAAVPTRQNQGRKLGHADQHQLELHGFYL